MQLSVNNKIFILETKWPLSYDRIKEKNLQTLNDCSLGKQYEFL